jgi:hypothetical protein
MNHSRRAQILSEVLEYVDRGDWEHHGDFLVFGNDAFETYVSQMSGERTVESLEHDETAKSLLELLSNQKVKEGEREIAKRVSLNGPPKDSSTAEIENWVSELPNEERKWIMEALQGYVSSPKHYSPDNNPVDAIDAALASAALRNLDDTVGRLSTLDVIGPIDGGFGGLRGAEYFEEAHGCDFAGHRIATAVLCRAMLEAALIERIDPKGKFKQNLKSGESHIGRMIDEAAKLHIDDERKKAAIEIRDAGNDAIHNLCEFKKKYAPRMRCIVDNLRKVLIDLYEN